MAFKAVMHIDGENLDVLHFNIRFTQRTDTSGKPTSKPQGGSLTVQIESTASNDLLNWMIAPNRPKDGKITFFRRDLAEGVLKTIEFTDGHCVDYSETFDHATGNPMIIQIVISARELKVGDADFSTVWSLEDLNSSGG